MSVSPLMHFAFEAAVSFILRFVLVFWDCIFIFILLWKAKEKTMLNQGTASVNRWKNLLLYLVEPPAVFMGRVGCFLTSLFGRNVGENLLELLCGKYFHWECLRDCVRRPVCSFPPIERRRWKNGTVENFRVWITCPPQLVKAGTVQHGASCCSHICCESSWLGHCISLHTLSVDVSVVTFSSCLVRGAVPEGGSAWSLLVACISHALLCWSRFSALVLPLSVSLWTQKWRGSADCKVHFFGKDTKIVFME